MSQADADIGVITMHDEETAAVLEALRRREVWVDRPSPDKDFFEGDLTFAASGQTVRVVGAQGSDAYERLRARFAPPVVALVGVAGGARSDVRLGDVVVSDEVVHGTADTSVTPPVMRRAVNDFFSIQGIEWGEGPFQVLRGRIGAVGTVDGILAVDTGSADVAHAYDETPDRGVPLHGWVAVLGISAPCDSPVGGSTPGGTAEPAAERDHPARHAALVFGAMLPVLGHRRRLVRSPN